MLEMNYSKYQFSIPKRAVLSFVLKDLSSDSRRVFLRAKSNILGYVKLIFLELIYFQYHFDKS